MVLWADSFTDGFASASGRAAVEVLEAAGLRGRAWSPSRPAAALTWISTGQLDAAQRIVRRTVDVLHPYVERGIPVRRAGAVLPGDAALGRRRARDDPRAAEVAAGVHSLAEVLSRRRRAGRRRT